MNKPKIWNVETVRQFILDNKCYWNDDVYINMKTKLNIRVMCGHDYNITLEGFINSKNKVCKKCSYKYNKSNTKYNINNIKTIASSVGIEVLSKEYYGIFEPMQFLCKCGKTFTTNWSEFNNAKKHTCNDCSKQRVINNLTLKIEDVKNRTQEISDCVLISDNYVDAHTPLIFQCECGRRFERTWANFNNEDKRKCTTCNANYSENEQTLTNILNELRIKYNSEHIFPDCKNVYPLRFDFYLPLSNICIEVDGEHHFSSQPYFGGDDRFIEIKKLDKIKDKYCKDNNIPLIRIPHWEFDDISKVKEMISKNVFR